MTTLVAPTALRSSVAGTVRAFGRLSTYRLVAISLGFLAVAAVLESAFGWTGYSPLVLVADLVVAVAATRLASAAVGRVVRSPSHGTSAIVTGLLLFFLMPPDASPLGLGLLAAAAVLAAASKVLLVAGGRHVFNPAAFGAFAVGLTGLTGASWWVGTLAMLPLVILAGVVLLPRIRLSGIAALFVLVGTGAVTAGQLSSGAPFAQSLTSTLVSGPIVFLGIFMLTEPFTLPPRPWQRASVAVLVGLLLAVPYVAAVHLLTFVPSPEAALLTGNVLSAVLSRPVAARLRFVGALPLTATSTEYRFTPSRPIPQRAGQYVELQVPHAGSDRRGMRRTLTIVSAPGGDHLAVAVRHTEPRSSFKRALAALRTGDEVRAMTVGGAFTLPRDRSVPVLLVASGIGLTPFVSQLRAEAAEVAHGAASRNIVLVLRVSSVDDVPYVDELAAFATPVLLVAPDHARGVDAVPPTWQRATDLDADALDRIAPDAADRRTYASGSPTFLLRARRSLRAVGVVRVRTDAFAGY